MAVSADTLTSVWQRDRRDLVAHARTFVQDRDTAEDIVQDCITEALEDVACYRGGSDARSIRAYLLGIIANLCRNASRQRVNHQRRIERLAAHMNVDSHRGVPPGDLYDLAIWLIRTSPLTPLQCQIVRLRIDGKPLRMIAPLVRLEHSTVRYHLLQAISVLQSNPSAAFLAGTPLSIVPMGFHVTRYRRPQRTGAGLDRLKLGRMR